jgi:hypothetical protein
LNKALQANGLQIETPGAVWALSQNIPQNPLLQRPGERRIAGLLVLTCEKAKPVTD